MSQENDFEIKVGDEFKTKLALKTALMLHSAAEGFEVTVEKSDKSVYTVVCSRKSEGCTWRLYANPVVGPSFREFYCFILSYECLSCHL